VSQVALLKKAAKHAAIALRNISLHRPGLCVICGYAGLFYAFDSADPHENLLCPVCRSVSRQRQIAWQLLRLLNLNGTVRTQAKDGLRHLDVLDAGGNSPLSRTVGTGPRWIRGAYSADGRVEPGFTFVDLQSIDFADKRFDVVITEDVLEHVPDLGAALSEIARVLKPGGFHLFTVPYYPDQATCTRAELIDGRVEHRLEPAYHWDPDTQSPILVFSDIGCDLVERLDEVGMDFTVLNEARRPAWRLLGQRDVYLSRKRP
jgi:SAM-dependent methyltransferase